MHQRKYQTTLDGANNREMGLFAHKSVNVPSSKRKNIAKNVFS